MYTPKSQESTSNQPDKGAILPLAAYRELVNIALLAVELGRSKLACRMAGNLQMLRPDLPHAQSVEAVADYMAGRQQDGVLKLEHVIRDFPDYQLGKALLAVGMREVGQGGWQSLLESVIEDGRDEHAIGLACDLLGQDVPLIANAAEVAKVPVGLAANAMWI
jgi:hypothetical protein